MRSRYYLADGEPVEVLPSMPPLPSARKYPTAVYVGGAAVLLVGGFFAFHELRKYLVKRKLAKLARDAAEGKIPTRVFLDAVMAEGPKIDPTAPRVTIEETPRLKCEAIFPFLANCTSGPDCASLRAGMEQMRRDGMCL